MGAAKTQPDGGVKRYKRQDETKDHKQEQIENERRGTRKSKLNALKNFKGNDKGRTCDAREKLHWCTQYTMPVNVLSAYTRANRGSTVYTARREKERPRKACSKWPVCVVAIFGIVGRQLQTRETTWGREGGEPGWGEGTVRLTGQKDYDWRLDMPEWRREPKGASANLGRANNGRNGYTSVEYKS